MEFPDREALDGLIDPRPTPEFARVHREPASDALDDPAAVARDELDRLDLDRLAPGATVAVGAGSRGIHAYDAVVAAVVAGLDDRGFVPVVVPASRRSASARRSTPGWRRTRWTPSRSATAV